MKDKQLLSEIEEIKKRMKQHWERICDNPLFSELRERLREDYDRMGEELDQKVLKVDFSNWVMGKDAGIYGSWQKEEEMESERIPAKSNPLTISTELYEKLVKFFIEEIKQNPQDWCIERKKDEDPYFDMLVIKHKSGRMHYKPRGHYIWGFSIEQWKEIKKILSYQKTLVQSQLNTEEVIYKLLNDNELCGKLEGKLSGWNGNLWELDSEEKVKEFKQQLEQAVRDISQSKPKENQEREKDNQSPKRDNDDYNNWTREQLITEINHLKTEIENLKNDQALTSSERQERIQENKKKLEKLTSYYNPDPRLNNSSNNFPTGWVIGGTVLVVITSALFLFISKRKIGRKKV